MGCKGVGKRFRVGIPTARVVPLLTRPKTCSMLQRLDATASGPEAQAKRASTQRTFHVPGRGDILSK